MWWTGRKVSYLRMCLWCNKHSRVFPEVRAVQQHMVDKGHCKLLHEGDAVLEYADFYDYRFVCAAQILHSWRIDRESRDAV